MIRSHINKGALVALALSVGVSMSLTGCEALGLSDGQPAQNSPPPKKAPKQAPKKADPKADEKAADVKEYERPVYPENVRRNPFQPEKEIIEPTVTENSDEVRPLEPLEQFDINRLSLVAIISSVVVPKAMFVDPKGVGHIVKERDRVGSQGAVIIDIRENEVDIQETSGEEGAGSRVRTIKLATDELKASSEGELSDEEREALERLLGSEQGRKQLRDRLGGPGAAPVDREGGGIAPPKL